MDETQITKTCCNYTDRYILVNKPNCGAVIRAGSIDVADAPLVFNLALPDGAVGVAYNQALSVISGYGTINNS